MMTTYYGRWCQFLFIGFLLVLFSHPACASTANSAPRQVNIRIDLKSIDKINSQAQTYRANFYLYADWIDPTVCRSHQVDQEGRIKGSPDWTPDLEYINSVDKVEPRHFTYEVVDRDSCKIEYWANIISVFQNEMQLQKFPFDSQQFPIIIESYEYDSTQLRFHLNTDIAVQKTLHGQYYPLCNKDKDCEYFTDQSVIQSIPEWRYDAFGLLLDEHGYKLEGKHYSRAKFILDMSRNYGFYLWKVMIPLGLIASLSWLIFMTGANDYLKRLGSSFTLFLSSVTFSLFTKSTLPAIPYLVLIDYYTLGTYFMIFISALVSTIVYRLSIKSNNDHIEHGQQLAKSIDKWSLRIFPATYILYCTVCTLLIL